jgi:hypothetical protein
VSRVEFEEIGFEFGQKGLRNEEGQTRKEGASCLSGDKPIIRVGDDKIFNYQL